MKTDQPLAAPGTPGSYRLCHQVKGAGRQITGKRFFLHFGLDLTTAARPGSLAFEIRGTPLQGQPGVTSWRKRSGRKFFKLVHVLNGRAESRILLVIFCTFLARKCRFPPPPLIL